MNEEQITALAWCYRAAQYRYAYPDEGAGVRWVNEFGPTDMRTARVIVRFALETPDFTAADLHRIWCRTMIDMAVTKRVEYQLVPFEKLTGDERNVELVGEWVLRESIHELRAQPGRSLPSCLEAGIIARVTETALNQSDIKKENA